MNEKYPYPIDDAGYIPSSSDDAQRAVNLLGEFKEDLSSADKETFLKGWFGLFFLGVVPHPDDVDDWPSELKPFATEAWRRLDSAEITEEQAYCSDSLQQGLRLQMDGNLKTYVIGSLDEHKGYVSAINSQEHGNQPVLTGSKSLAYIYDSPADAVRACRHLELNAIEVYGGKPDQNLDCPNAISIPVKDLIDIQVVIQTEDGLFLYRDGKTLGDSPVHACKYWLYADNVEQQIQQVKTELGVTWKWLEYSKLI